MLTVTPNATAVIEQITSLPEIPEGAGLRIATQPEGFTLAVTPAPERDDQVLEEEEGARLFLDASAATALDDKTLDAQVDAGGNVQFFLAG
jgi:iron-sulfur cluster assembly protein